MSNKSDVVLVFLYLGPFIKTSTVMLVCVNACMCHWSSLTPLCIDAGLCEMLRQDGGKPGSYALFLGGFLPAETTF